MRLAFSPRAFSLLRKPGLSSIGGHVTKAVAWIGCAVKDDPIGLSKVRLVQYPDEKNVKGKQKMVSLLNYSKEA